MKLHKKNGSDETSDPFLYTYIVYITRQRGYDRNTRKR